MGGPAFCLVKSFRARVGHFDSSEPFHMFFAEVPRNDETQWITVAIRQLRAVHFISKQGSWLQRLIERNCVSVIIDTVKAHPRSVGQRHCPVENVPQRKAFPDSVAD